MASVLTDCEMRTDAVFHFVAQDTNVGMARAHSFSSCSQGARVGSAGRPGIETEKLSVQRHQIKYPQAVGFPACPCPTVGLPVLCGGSWTLPGLRTVPAALSLSVALRGRPWWALFKSLLLPTLRSAQARVLDILAPLI